MREIITVPLARPRTDKTATDPKYVALCAQLWETMKDEAARAILEK
jgi:hypothetical protein